MKLRIIIIMLITTCLWGQEWSVSALPDSMPKAKVSYLFYQSYVFPDSIYSNFREMACETSEEYYDLCIEINGIKYELMFDDLYDINPYQNLLNILEQYEKECYADSTLHYEYAGYMSSGFGDIQPVGAPIRSYWIHKELTFQGFIEFLKRKVKP